MGQKTVDAPIAPMRRAIARIAVALFGAIALATPAFAGDAEKARDLVADAAETLGYFASDSNYEGLWDLMDEAKAILVIPRSVRGGFVVGGSSGRGVLIAKKEGGGWSEPVFFRIGSVSIGFQAGGEVSETVLAVMTDRGVRDLYSSTVKLGADLSIAAGPIGGGAKVATADVLAFSRSQGVYGGVSFEGGILKVKDDWNEAYFGEDVTPRQIIRHSAASNPASAELIRAAAALAAKDSR